MRAACFGIIACGFVPRCALDVNDSGTVRFAEIVRMITECDLSVHDISRVELDNVSSLPRFNMPFELGADLGLRLGGSRTQKRRRTLVLDTEPHRYDKTLSDISGMDIGAHRGETEQVIRLVRDWLNTNRAKGSTPLPGATALCADHIAFMRIAGDIASDLRLDPHDQLPHADYIHVVAIALPLIEKERAATR